ncbi:MAG: aminoacyl-tRNA hydrolase [Bdellovibrionales bacterium]
MKLIVGLGNPGQKYILNRHNVGFLMMDGLLEQLSPGSSFKTETQFKAQICKLKWQGQDLLLVKPQTYMNRSGEAVHPIMSFYRIERPDLLVVHDDVDLPFGEFRFHIRRGPGGQNGIKNIHQILGSDDYARLKMGVGRPADPRHSIADYVLANFTEPADKLAQFLGDGLDAIEYWIKNGTERAANQFNAAAKG